MSKILPVLLVLLTAGSAYCDDGSSGAVRQGEVPPGSESESAASFDKRLPPVLPGEEVRDGKKKMKVWSTSGPVPVNNDAAAAPEPWKKSGEVNLGEVGVIIDREDGSRRRDNR